MVDLDGQGTSAATPQVAAAAALWIAKYRAQLEKYPEKWMRGEAARQALIRSARKKTDKLSERQVRDALGAGAIDALAALAFEPLAAGALRRAPVASAAWDWLKLLTGRGVGLAPEASPRGQMLALEVLQLAGWDPRLEKIIADPEGTRPRKGTQRRFLERLRENPKTSATLKAAIEEALGTGRGSRTLPKLPPVRPKNELAPAKSQERRDTGEAAPTRPGTGACAFSHSIPAWAGRLNSSIPTSPPSTSATNGIWTARAN